MTKLRDIWRVIRGDLSSKRVEDLLWEIEERTKVDGMFFGIQSRLTKIESAITAIVPGMARVVAKIDAMYTTPEDDPQRKADSDRLGREVLQRLGAEEKARRLTGGTT